LQQTYRTDTSNRDLRFARNRLRHEVLPALQELSAGDMVENLLQLAHQAAEILEPVRNEARRHLDRLEEIQGNVVLLHLDRVGEVPDPSVLREMFVELWRQREWPRGQMTSLHWEQLAAAFVTRSSSGRMFPGGVQIKIVGTVLQIKGA
jgi:tRNA(Ile)-lysidine synthase